MGVGAHRTVIGNDPQDALGLLAGLVSGIDRIGLGFRRVGSDVFGSVGAEGGSGNCVADCAVVGGSDGVCCAQSLLANGLASNRNGKKRISFLKTLFPPSIIIPHHGDKFPGFLSRMAIAIGFKMRPGRCIYGARGIVTAPAQSHSAGANIVEQEYSLRCGGLL